MLVKTSGVVIHYLKYSETSIITKVYTEELGLQTYLVSGVRSAKNRNKIALYQPLSLLDMVVYYQKDVQRIYRISEVKPAPALRQIPFEPNKTAVALFLSEALYRILKEDTPQPELYAYLKQHILWLDNATEGLGLFHSYFLLHLATFLGFGISQGSELLAQVQAYNPSLIGPTEQAAVADLLDALLLASQPPSSHPAAPLIKHKTVDALLDFYRLHIDNMPALKSLAVLREVMRS